MSSKYETTLRIKLDKEFVKHYNLMQESYGEELAKLNGFSPDQLNFTQFIDNFIDTNTIADASIDGSANVASKDIVTLMSEMSKPQQKLLAFNKLFYEMNKKYGIDAAKEWLRNEWIGYLYMHDANTCTFKHYCFTGDTKVVTKDGLKRMDELVGKKIKVLNKNHGWENATVQNFGKRNFVKLTLQRYGVKKEFYTTDNHIWFVTDRNGNTTEFSTSLLERGMKIPYNTNYKESGNVNWMVLSVEHTDRFEDSYCVVAPETQSFTLEGNVLTHNCFAYDLKDLAENGLYFIDNYNAEPPRHTETFVNFIKEFVSYASNRSSGACGMPNVIVYLYYFWSRDVKEGHYIKSPDYYARQCLQSFIYALNQPYTRDGIQPAFTNTSVFDRPYLEALFGGSTFPDGKFMIDEIEEIVKFEKIFMEVMSDIRAHNMMTYPVNSISLLRKGGKFVDEPFAKWACEHNRKWNDSNLFIDDSVTSLSNCCRLKSNIKDLGYFNSIGGAALKVGSVKVSTINLARIALESFTEEEFLSTLAEKVNLDMKVLDCVRTIIKRNVEKGLLKNFSHGLVDFEHLYNTIGFIGCYETMKKFGYTRVDELGNTYYTDKAIEFGRKIFETIHREKDNFSKRVDYSINCEQIPGESAAAKLMKKDMIFHPETTITDLPLYGNQFIPLGIKTTLVERVRIASIFDGFCNGGSILHCNVEGQFSTFEQAWDMLNYIADQGVTYFAFNTKIQACAKNHAFFGKKCPDCGGPVDTEYTRIVGFYTPVKTYSKERKAEFAMREWEKVNG